MRSVQLIDHETFNRLSETLLGHAADRVSTLQHLKEIAFRPRYIKAASLNVQDFIHILADQPADLSFG
jgi:hypothetical protein